MSREQEVFVLADWELLEVVNKIADEQWELDASSIPHWGTTKLTLRDIVNRHAYDDAWVPETLAGKTIEEVGTKYDGDLLGDNPKVTFANYVEAAVTAVEEFPESELDKTVHLSYGDFPAREYLKHILTFRGFRVYTIATFIGADATMSSELVDGLWELVVPKLESWRQLGIFGPALQVPENADKQTKLLAMVGFLQQ